MTTAPAVRKQGKDTWRYRDVMDFLGCSRAQVWNHIRYRGLPCHKLGEHTSPLYFYEDEVREWRNTHEIDATHKEAS
jgi:predicted DNA-binding transcriptional regulator AlpA